MTGKYRHSLIILISNRSNTFIAIDVGHIPQGEFHAPLSKSNRSAPLQIRRARGGFTIKYFLNPCFPGGR
jgi:hypothetical protein